VQHKQPQQHNGQRSGERAPAGGGGRRQGKSGGSSGQQRGGVSSVGTKRPADDAGDSGRPQRLAKNQCAYCRQLGHWKEHCPKRPVDGQTSGGKPRGGKPSGGKPHPKDKMD
jgi:hypothetical protein